MNKDLPSVFANPINKEFKNNKLVFYGDGKEIRSVSKSDVNRKINEIFASSTHVYKSKVKITTLSGVIDAVIVGKTNNYLLTLDGKKINIYDIQNIEKV